MLQLEAIETGYKNPFHEPFTTYIERGEFLMVIGANGSGKSTFLKTICGITSLLNGQILLEGNILSKMSLKERALKVSFVNSSRPSISFMTGFDLALMGRFPHNNFTCSNPSDIEILMIMIQKLNYEK